MILKKFLRVGGIRLSRKLALIFFLCIFILILFFGKLFAEEVSILIETLEKEDQDKEEYISVLNELQEKEPEAEKVAYPIFTMFNHQDKGVVMTAFNTLNSILPREKKTEEVVLKSMFSSGYSDNQKENYQEMVSVLEKIWNNEIGLLDIKRNEFESFLFESLLDKNNELQYRKKLINLLEFLYEEEIFTVNKEIIEQTGEICENEEQPVAVRKELLNLMEIYFQNVNLKTEEEIVKVVQQLQKSATKDISVDVENLLNEMIKKREKAVKKDKNNLDLGVDSDSVGADLDLPGKGDYHTIIEWQSSNDSVINSSGEVSRPEAGEGDREVILTATISRGNVSQEREFKLIVIENLTDEEAVNRDLKELKLNDEVHHNIKLPQKGKNGSQISWESSDESILNSQGEVNLSGENDSREVTLTATVSRGSEQKERDFNIKVSKNNFAGYLLSYFKSDEEALYYAVSSDGFHWEVLNHGRPVLEAQKGNKSIRDPHIIRNKEGNFFLLSTNSWESNKILIWDSDNLIEWENERVVQISFDDARNAWAPESFYCSDKDTYIVFWASARKNTWQHRMYYAETDDFKEFKEPKLLLDNDYPVIDSTMIKNEGTVYQFVKDEREGHPEEKSIKWTYSENCTGPWNEFTNEKRLSEPIVDHVWVEGPTVFKDLEEEKWYLYYDEYGEGKWGLHISEDLEEGNWEQVSPQKYELPSGARHGSVLPITKKEMENLFEEFGE